MEQWGIRPVSGFAILSDNIETFLLYQDCDQGLCSAEPAKLSSSSPFSTSLGLGMVESNVRLSNRPVLRTGVGTGPDVPARRIGDEWVRDQI